jgi:hypothetical protein
VRQETECALLNKLTYNDLVHNGFTVKDCNYKNVVFFVTFRIILVFYEGKAYRIKYRFRIHSYHLTLFVQVQEASDEVMQKKDEVLKDIAQHKQQIREAKGEPIREATAEPIREAKGEPTRDVKGEPTREVKGESTREAKGLPTREAKGEPT